MSGKADNRKGRERNETGVGEKFRRIVQEAKMGYTVEKGNIDAEGEVLYEG